MKKLTLERVVPIISASVSCLILAIKGLGLLSLPEIGQQEEQACEPLLTHIDELIHQILLNPNVAREQMGEEQLGEYRLFREARGRWLISPVV